jgi:hypothetical protein
MKTSATSIEDVDASVRRQSYAAAKNDIELLDRLILHINHGQGVVSGRPHDLGVNLLGSFFLVRAFNSLWRAREDAVCGYYVEAFTLCRAALEAWGCARWVELHPESTNRWLWAFRKEKEGPIARLPSFEEIWKDLGTLGEFPRFAYDRLSKFAHSKSEGLAWLFQQTSSETRLLAGAHFDGRNLRDCLFLLALVAQACLEPVARLQNQWLGQVDEMWLLKAREISKEAEIFIHGVEAQLARESAGPTAD